MGVEFSCVHVVQFSETDMAGVVHFSNYFRWMEEVEHGFFRSVGLSVFEEGGERAVSWPRVAASCEYAGPARFEEEVTLRLRVGRVGEKSLSYEVEFLVGKKVIGMGKLTSVCCAVVGGKFSPIAIPAEVRAKLTGARKHEVTKTRRTTKGE